MTYVRAEALDGGTFMRSDLAVSVVNGGVIEALFPLPKILILDPSFAIGIAGDDPQGGLIGLQSLWASCDSAADLRDAIEDDGALYRQFLMLTHIGEVWRYEKGTWTGPRREGWIGSQEARQLQDPDPFKSRTRHMSEATESAYRESARSEGFDENTIEAVLSGEVNQRLAPEISQRNAMRAAGADVSEFMIEARLVEGKFRFDPQTPIARVFGNRVLRTERDVVTALLGPALTVSHQFHSVEDQYPATLTIEFLGAKVTFLPCMNRGYSHRLELLDPATQKHLHF